MQLHERRMHTCVRLGNAAIRLLFTFIGIADTVSHTPRRVGPRWPREPLEQACCYKLPPGTAPLATDDITIAVDFPSEGSRMAPGQGSPGFILTIYLAFS